MMSADNPQTDMAERLARVADIQKTAQVLLDNPEAAAAFRRVGVSGDFTPQEQEAIHERLGLGKYSAGENIYFAPDYQGIVQALARRVAASVYRTVFDDEAHAWMLSNTLAKGQPGITEQRIAFDDFLVVLRDFMAWDKLPEHLNALKSHEFDPNSEYDKDEQLYGAAAPLHEKSKELFRKYGHMGIFDVVSVTLRLNREGKTADDVDAVRHYATLLCREKLSNGIERTEEAERLAQVEEHQKMAQAFLDDPEVAAAFRRVGLSGDFTQQEHEAIHERLGLGNYDPYDNMMIALDYQGIAQALARRVAAGVYRTVFDDEAHAWALSNTFLRGNYNGLLDQRIAFDDFLVVLREFMAWDKLPEHLNALKTFKPDPSSVHDQDEQLYELYGPLHAKSRQLFRKYGHVGQFDVVHVSLMLIREGKTAADCDAVRH